VSGTPKPLLQALRGERPAQVPIWLMRQAGRYLPEYRALRAKAGSFLDLCYRPDMAAEVTLQPIRRFGMDGAILFADILLIPHALGQDLSFREGEGPVLRPLGEVALPEGRDIHATLAPVYETVARVKAALPPACTMIGFAGAPWTVATYMIAGRGGDDQVAAKRMMWGDPKGFAVLIARLEAATIDYLCRQIEAGAEVVQIFDTWAGALPETEFHLWCRAPIERIARGVKARHPTVPVIAFPRGAGFHYAAFEDVDAVSLDGGVAMAFAQQLQKTRTVQGNLDPQLLVQGGEAMRAGAARLLDGLAGGRYIFNLGHGIVPQTPPEHVGALVEQVHAWR
jgi:uroporphyrinogen decarboxylase